MMCYCIIIIKRFCAVADEGNDYIYVMGGYYNKYKAYQYKVSDFNLNHAFDTNCTVQPEKG